MQNKGITLSRLKLIASIVVFCHKVTTWLWSYRTGEVLNLYQSFTGKDTRMSFIAFESAINGTMPVISPNSSVKFHSFKEVFRRVDRGRVESNGTVTFEVDGQVNGFLVLQNIAYDELNGCESGVDSFNVEFSVLHSKYDEKQKYSGVAIKSSIINASKQEGDYLVQPRK